MAVAERYIDALHRRVQDAVDTDGPLETRLGALARACGEYAQSTVSLEQGVYDALDHVSDSARDHVSQLYVSRVLDPVVAVFSAAVDAGDLVCSWTAPAPAHTCDR
ncbi:hypothetical protein C6A87_015245 [Mycobacterium sp. ITM-2016-00317]|uniref:hypothetical protein n=1 Tax=Mycobacterium sp. ITM-2016-00317 TaxID=2099694 RepID=UPI00287FCFD2|nr:hypothetical protein [Mycobacterium sp. ITM-2016-00317]WNG85322.1 hypothetical protein C6A87_015245 [Mycobacterium sp. ITM-2016-00317]